MVTECSRYTHIVFTKKYRCLSSLKPLIVKHTKVRLNLRAFPLLHLATAQNRYKIWQIWHSLLSSFTLLLKKIAITNTAKRFSLAFEFTDFRLSESVYCSSVPFKLIIRNYQVHFPNVHCWDSPPLQATAFTCSLLESPRSRQTSRRILRIFES
jgi:hypothetical protein